MSGIGIAQLRSFITNKPLNIFITVVCLALIIYGYYLTR
jgi:hypothetical protein